MFAHREVHFTTYAQAHESKEIKQKIQHQGIDWICMQELKIQSADIAGIMVIKQNKTIVGALK